MRPGPPQRIFLTLLALASACATTPPAESPPTAQPSAPAPASPAPAAAAPQLAAPPVAAPADAAALTAAPPAAAPRPHWAYEGPEGPAHWGDESPAYEACKLGKQQSPIDIRGAKAAKLPPLAFSYQASPLHIINNGHTIQVNVPPGSFLNVGGKQYALVQFHFHHPSENELNGKAFPMEAHLVHKDTDGKLAVVAVLLAGGKTNAFIASLWKAIPPQEGEESAPEGVTVDPNRLLPPSHAYFTFPGSLTTPPCSEDVTWFVLRTPVSLSQGEVSAFAAKYPNNARPVQPLNGRTVERTK
jgi:carbonic anhydrase